MKATHRQFKSTAQGHVRSSSGWDGKTLVQVFRDLRDELGYTYSEALEVTRQIRNNRLHALVIGDSLHTSDEQAFLWLLDSGVGPVEAMRRVWKPQGVPCYVWDAYARAWSRLNWEHRQELEDARYACASGGVE